MNEEYTHWWLDLENTDIFPHSNEGNEVYLQKMSGNLEGEHRIIIWCDLSEDEDSYPALTIDQAKQLHWALGKALKEYKTIKQLKGER
jgi:hypothetical protein